MINFSDRAICEKICQHTTLHGKQVLEIGCGNGRISTLLAGYTCALTAIDPDESAIENARKRTTTVDFRVGSGEDLPFADNHFDVILFTLSLHHQNSSKALSEARRTVKEQGTIIVVEPVAEGEIEKVFAFVHNENEEKRQAQQAIADSDLTLISSEIFYATWQFNDREDLLHSLFQHYSAPLQEDIAQNIIDFLGDKIHSQPIVLEDTMVIQTLQLPSRNV